jgi:HEAT repeat protein
LFTQKGQFGAVVPITTGMYAILLASLALTTLTTAFSFTLYARRLGAQRRRGAAREALELVEPIALDLLEGEAPADLPAEHEVALAESLSRLAPMVTGDTRAAIGRHFESTGAVERACRRLADPRPHIRASTAAQLGDMCSDVAELPLLQALHDSDADVRLAAARSLGRLKTRPAVTQLLNSLVRREVPRAVATGALLSIGAAALPGVRQLLAHAHHRAREDAVELLGLLGNPADSMLLQERLADDDDAVRSRACHALRRLGTHDAKHAVESALADPAAEVRAAAAEALGHLGDRESAVVLIHAAQSDDADVARAAAESLVQIAPGFAARVAASSNASPQIRRAARVTAGDPS